MAGKTYGSAKLDPSWKKQQNLGKNCGTCISSEVMLRREQSHESPFLTIFFLLSLFLSFYTCSEGSDNRLPKIFLIYSTNVVQMD